MVLKMVFKGVISPENLLGDLLKKNGCFIILRFVTNFGGKIIQMIPANSIKTIKSVGGIVILSMLTLGFLHLQVNPHTCDGGTWKTVTCFTPPLSPRVSSHPPRGYTEALVVTLRT